MSTESENLYTKNDQLIAQIYDNLSGENKSEEAISLLLNPNHISPTEQVKILGLLGEKDERFHSLLIKTVLNNINILDNSESFKIINNNFITNKYVRGVTYEIYIKKMEKNIHSSYSSINGCNIIHINCKTCG